MLNIPLFLLSTESLIAKDRCNKSTPCTQKITGVVGASEIFQ